MDKHEKAVIVAEQKQSVIPQAVKYGVAVAGTVGMANLAHAAEISTIAQGLTGEIDGAKTIIIGLFTAGAVLLGIFAGFRYLKRGANSA